MVDLDLPGGDCTRAQLDALVDAIKKLLASEGNPAPDGVGVIDASTYPFAEQHLLLCISALHQAQCHAQMAAYYVSRGE